MIDTKRPLRVFLCHASDDKPAVMELYERLVRDGVDAWLDKEKLIPGQNWQIEIPKAVRNSDVVIVCLSSRSVNKEGFIQKEIRIALDVADEKPEGTIFIIPARLEGCNIPERISQIHWVDLFSDNGYERLLKALQMRANTLRVLFEPFKLLSKSQSKGDLLGNSSRNVFGENQRIQIYLQGDFHSLTSERKSAVIVSLAGLLNTPPQSIEIFRISEGSIIFDLSMPRVAVEHLRLLLQSNDPQLHLLGVEKVKLEMLSGKPEIWAKWEEAFSLYYESHSASLGSVREESRNARFSSEDLTNASVLLTELLTEVSIHETSLSGMNKLGVGGTAIKSLLDSKILFGNPIEKLFHLTAGQFEKTGNGLNELRKRQMRESNFYYVTVPVSIDPKNSAVFRKFDCVLSFSSEDLSETVIHSIFPKSEWKGLLNSPRGVNLGLDDNLEFGVAEEVSWQTIAPKYFFRLGRATIYAMGEGDTQCQWTIEDPDFREDQTLQFLVVFSVPKATTKITMTGIVTAEPSMDWLNANIRNIAKYLSKRSQDLLRSQDRIEETRLLIGDSTKWTIPLPV